jgi:hypothetical protein
MDLVALVLALSLRVRDVAETVARWEYRAALRRVLREDERRRQEAERRLDGPPPG